MQKERITFEAPPDLMSAARKAAEGDDRSLSAFIRTAIRSAIESQTQPERAA